MKRKTLGQRRNLKEQDRRDAIILSAIRVFSAKGYGRATMEDIARDSGISKALIYWYWEGKAALFTELIDRCMMPYCELLEKIIDSDRNYMDKVMEFVVEFPQLFQKNEDLNKIVHFGSLHFKPAKAGENFNEKVNAYYRRVQELIQELVNQGIDTGYLKADLDKQAFSFFLLLSVEGYIYMSMLEERMPLERALINFALKIIFPDLEGKGK